MVKAAPIVERIKENAPDHTESILCTLLMLYVLEKFYGPYVEESQRNVEKA